MEKLHRINFRTPWRCIGGRYYTVPKIKPLPQLVNISGTTTSDTISGVQKHYGTIFHESKMSQYIIN